MRESVRDGFMKAVSELRGDWCCFRLPLRWPWRHSRSRSRTLKSGSRLSILDGLLDQLFPPEPQAACVDLHTIPGSKITVVSVVDSVLLVVVTSCSPCGSDP